MIRNRLYYALKPMIPSSTRMAVRRWFAQNKRKRAECVWPILPGSEKRPAGWIGWPEGKRFAFVLTHDVESARGVERSPRLMELEAELGFCSSFNFIPEGGYRTSPMLLNDLRRNGFEVGVHDLHHDGKLYRNREDFRRKAHQINRHLKGWGAVGFRSGFMLHNLEWLHDLTIAYDASTFDTDPFEPQPDGAWTIFPFWVPAPVKTEIESLKSDPTSDLRSQPSRSGYVELPYTLPQDSTLFLLFRERTPEIWFKKLDWIAENGGMALVNVHPDYTDFSGKSKGRNGEYPVQLYRELLEYVQSRYAGQYWHALPHEVATHLRSASHSPDKSDDSGGPLRRKTAGNGEFPRQPATTFSRHLQGKRAAVLLFSYYPADPRPRRAAEALANEGVVVDLLCLRQNRQEPKREIINGVNVCRVPLRRLRRGKVRYVGQYFVFILRSFFFLGFRSIFRRYDFVHVHNMPDILVLGALVPKALGAKIILDLHDPMPELMMTIYNIPPETRLVRWLKHLEKLSISLANLVVTPNIAFRELFISRGCPPERIEIIMNSPESDIFYQSTNNLLRTASVNGVKPFKIMYHGLIAERHGLDIALQAIANLRSNIPALEFHIFGDRTPYMDDIEVLAKDLGLKDCVRYHGYQQQTEISKSISSIDLGIIPNRRSPFTELNMPTRIFEYIAIGKPVVVPDTRGIRDYFQQDSALFFEPGDPQSLADVILDIYRNPEKANSTVARSKSVYEAHCWDSERVRFLNSVAKLVADKHDSV